MPCIPFVYPDDGQPWPEIDEDRLPKPKPTPTLPDGPWETLNEAERDRVRAALAEDQRVRPPCDLYKGGFPRNRFRRYTLPDNFGEYASMPELWPSRPVLRSRAMGRTAREVEEAAHRERRS